MELSITREQPEVTLLYYYRLNVRANGMFKYIMNIINLTISLLCLAVPPPTPISNPRSVSGTNAFCASDERFSAGNEHVENVFKLHTHTHKHKQPATIDFQK